MAILPVGTANNIGHAISLTGRALESLIAEWDTARRVSFDVGEVQGPWGSNYFVEGVGVGLFAATILSEQRTEPAIVTKACREDEVTRVLQTLKDGIQKHRPKKIKVFLDDEDLSDDYVLIQALNIRYAGPNLDLAPSADTNDGLLDVVLVRRGEEGKLSRYLAHCIKRKSAKANLIVRRARRLQIESNGFPVHIDDKARPVSTGKRAAHSNAIDIKVSKDAVIFLCPQKIRRRPQRPAAEKRG
jgi:diacylglycerol kinase family enzyme